MRAFPIDVKHRLPMEDFFSNYFQYMRHPAFLAGGVTFVLVFGIGLWLVGRVTAAWNSVNQFFVPARAPAPPKPNPSPFRLLTSCLFSLFFLFVLFGLLAIVLFTLWRV